MWYLYKEEETDGEIKILSRGIFAMTELLENYLKAVEVKKEEKRLELLRRTLDALDQLSREINFKKAYVFGSVLKKKKFYYDSDIDIAVLGLKDEDFFYFMSRAAEILGRDVDVAQLEKHRLKDKIMKDGLLWIRQN